MGGLQGILPPAPLRILRVTGKLEIFVKSRGWEWQLIEGKSQKIVVFSEKEV